MARRIGELLVDAGVLSQSQLEQALFAQRKDGRKLGHLLVELGLVSEIQLTQTLSRQLSVPWVSLYHVDFSRSLLNVVSRETAEKYCLVPIFVRKTGKEGDTLFVAMDDPTNEVALGEVSRASSLPVKPMIACPSDIRAAIRVYYLGETPSAPAGVPAPAPAKGTRSKSAPPPSSQSPRPPPRPPKLKVAPAPEPEPSASEPAAEPAPAARESKPAPPARESKPPEKAAAKKRPGRTISLTLLDGTTISIPARTRKGSSLGSSLMPPDPDGEPDEGKDQLTARDLVSAMRAVAHGVDASDILGAEPRWEAMFSALLSILLRKGIIADWEFVEEFRKV